MNAFFNFRDITILKAQLGSPMVHEVWIMQVVITWSMKRFHKFCLNITKSNWWFCYVVIDEKDFEGHGMHCHQLGRKGHDKYIFTCMFFKEFSSLYESHD
jgi:hypothetical protein